MNVSALILAIASVIIVPALGYAAAKQRRFSAEQARGFSGLALTYALPAALFLTMAGFYRTPLIEQVPVAVIVLIGYAGLYLVFYRLLRARAGARLKAALRGHTFTSTAAPIYGLTVLTPICGNDRRHRARSAHEKRRRRNSQGVGLSTGATYYHRREWRKGSMGSDEQEVLDVFRHFLKGMEQRMPESLLDMVLPNGTMTRVANGKHQQISIAALLDMFPREGTSLLEERIYDPVVRTDGDIAVIWCSYDFRVDGEVSHTGSNIVDLARVNGRWIITGLSDTARFALPE
jgi:hypothetical protein